MILSGLLEWLLGARAGQLGIAIALLAMLLYWRKLTRAGSIVESLGARLAFAAATLGLLLLLGVVTGLDVARAGDLATTAWVWARDVFAMGWEAIKGWL